MTLFILYFMKVNIALVVLYFFYKLLFSKDTFFGLRRLMLILIYIIAFTYPLFDLSAWMIADNNVTGVVNTLYQKVLPEITIVSGTADNASSFPLVTIVFTGLYIAGTIILLTRTLLEISKTCIMLHHSKKVYIDGIRICQPKEKQEPYSFFKWICVYPGMYNEKETKEILVHEQTHVRELHSADILLAQLVIILCWFNPFAWLMRSEMRINHEYLADRKVVTSGYDRKTYQYHLLGLKQNQPAAANLYNNFSVLPLKNRIKMLNRKRTRNIMRSKYLMFIPVTALLILFSNCTNTGKEESTEEKAEVKYVPTEVEPDTVDIANAVFDMVEEMPEFKGGNKALMDYLAANLQYPKGAETKGTQGRVIVQFIVNTDGSIDNAKVLRSVDPELDAEALRVINGMPKWKPGTQKGEPVRVKYTVPVVFRLK